MQARQEPVLVDEFQVGLDRAKITESAQIELPEAHDSQSEDSDDDARLENPQSSSQKVVDSIKKRKHRAGLKIRQTLHIGRASDDFAHTTTALAGAGSEDPGSRYMTDAPEPNRPTVKDLIHNPFDTVRAKISEQTDKQSAGQITAKEVPHGDEVNLIHASEAVNTAQNDAERLLAIKNLSRLMKERQATYARWTFDRHITKIRRLPRDEVKLRPRSDFEKYDPLEGWIIDWRAYAQSLLVYHAHQYGSQYIGYGSDPPEPSKQTILPNIERLLIASSPLQELVMTSRRIYRWEEPATTAKYLLLYSILWYSNLLLPGCLSACIYLVIQRRAHGNTMEDLRADIKHREDQRKNALSLTELIVKEGEESWSDKLIEGLGPWLMLQLADLANFCESLRNFYEWRVPHRTSRTLIFLGIVTVITAIVPVWLLVKTTTFTAGVTYFALYPIAVNFPDYRLLASPTKRFLWNIPTHAEWAVQYVQAEGTRLAQKPAPVVSDVIGASPTFDPDHDYNSYTAKQDKVNGRLVIGANSIRFLANHGHSVLWNLRYDELERIEKVDRIVARNIPSKLQEDPGEDLKFVDRSGRVSLLRKVDRRNEAFSQIVGFSDMAWQVVW